MTYKKRGSGRTTKQMQEAPQNSVFVWVHHDLHYPKKLAEKIGRNDLKIVSPNWLLNGWRGVQLSGLVIDHFAHTSFTEEMKELSKQALLNVGDAK
jgi:hypothetical protein